MANAKDDVRKLLESLPDDASFEDIQYQLYLLDEISRGSEEIDRGEAVDHVDVERRLAKWLKE
jgi:predicted transcriptional regulator